MKKILVATLSFLSLANPALAAGHITLSAVGDVMMGTDYPSDRLPADGGMSLFKYAQERLKTSDIRFGNFEDTFFDGEKGDDGKSSGANRFIFRTPTRFGAALAQAGFNVVSLANNHALDFGAAGIRSTKQTLRANGIQFSSKGGGEVAQFNVRGTRVAVIATDFYKGARSVTTPEVTFEEIRGLKKSFDIVVVSSHVGGEGAGAEHVRDRDENFLGENRGNSVEFAHGAIDAGASLIIMHGPHVPRGMEVYKGHLIAYSLGNFLTGPGISVGGIAGLAPLLQVELDGEGQFVRGAITSFRQVRESGTIYDPNQTAFKFMQNLSVQDFPNSSPQFSASGLFFPN